MLLMWNSKIQIDGGGNTVVSASVLEVRNLVVLRVRFKHPQLSLVGLVFTYYYLVLSKFKRCCN